MSRKKIAKKAVKKAAGKPVKNPLLAAIFNIIPGVGYLYVGKRKVFAFLLLAAVIVGLVEGYVNMNISDVYNIYYWIGSFLVMIAFMYDAYDEARN